MLGVFHSVFILVSWYKVTEPCKLIKTPKSYSSHPHFSQIHFYHLSTNLPPCKSWTRIPFQTSTMSTVSLVPHLTWFSNQNWTFPLSSKVSWFCLTVSGKFLTPRLAVNNWFNSDETEDKIIAVEKNASTILITKGTWLTKFPLCPSSTLKAKERDFHFPFLIPESFPTCLITHTICS